MQKQVLGFLQVYEYTFDKSCQNPGELSFISQKIRTVISANFFYFKFNSIFTLLPCNETLLITNPIHVFLSSN